MRAGPDVGKLEQHLADVAPALLRTVARIVIRKVHERRVDPKDVAATVRKLRSLPGVTRVASIGYCFGGLLSYLTAAAGTVDTAVAYYGGGIQNNLDKADALKVPLLMHFGGRDEHIPASTVKQIADRFGEREEVEIHIYPDAEHGFNCSHRSTYHQRSAVEAHGHTLLFLAETL